MLELLLCSVFTILPDYLYRRYGQGKRFGKEITFYSVWFELRWGITACVILTVCLITTVFYNHPSTKNVTLFFRTIPIVPETNGRVAETFVSFSGPVAAGAPIFRLDSSKQEAAVETARHKIAQVDAEQAVARTDVLKADGQIKQATSARQQTLDELETKQELYRRNPGNVPFREIERLEVRAEGQLGDIAAATAAKQGAEERVATLIPAQKASAQAELEQAQVELNKTVIRAGVSGRVRAVHAAGWRYRKPIDASGWCSDPRRCRWAVAASRLRSDRSADHEGRNGGRSHLRLKAFYRDSHGGERRAGLHRRWSVPRRGAAH